MKTCTLCNTPKPATSEYFYRRTPSRDGLSTYCKACHRLASKDSYDKNPTKYRESKQTRTDQKRRSIYAQKQPLDLARTMAVIVSAVQVWRDHDPAKFTEFKNLMKERIAP